MSRRQRGDHNSKLHMDRQPTVARITGLFFIYKHTQKFYKKAIEDLYNTIYVLPFYMTCYIFFVTNIQFKY